MTNQEAPKVASRNGIQELADEGVPDGACSALLGALANRNRSALFRRHQVRYGGSLPEVVSPTQFWIVVRE
jgi:hypothetical protein